MSLLYKFASLLYDKCYPLYRALYSGYKQVKDRHEIKFFKKNIKKGDVVLDIGANIGIYTKLFSKLVGVSGKVHAFEPDSQNFKHLSECSKKNIILNKVIVSSKPGLATLYLSNRLNVDHRTYMPKTFSKSIKLPATSIDSYVKNMFKVNFVKIDVQGAEFEVLTGMKKTIELNPDIVLFMEFWPEGFREAAVKPGDILNLLLKFKFKLFKLDCKLEKIESFDSMLNIKGDKYCNLVATKRKNLFL